jgi:hypothetical protein
MLLIGVAIALLHLTTIPQQTTKEVFGHKRGAVRAISPALRIIEQHLANL